MIQSSEIFILFYLLVFMRPPTDIVGEGIMFSGCSSAAFVPSFVRTDHVTTIYYL